MSIYFRDQPQWDHSALGHFHISTLEFVSVVVLASELMSLVVDASEWSCLGYAPTSGGSSSSLETLVVPTSVKRTRAKRRKSDEEVWEWPDNKIIGMYRTRLHCLHPFKHA